jgi:hypothetical protein
MKFATSVKLVHGGQATRHDSLRRNSGERARTSGSWTEERARLTRGGVRSGGYGKDLGLDGALDERPQPRHGQHEQPQRRVVARLRVPGPAGAHRRRGIEQHSGAVERRAGRGRPDPSPRPGPPPPGAQGNRAGARRRGAEREEEAPRGRGSGVHLRLGDKAAGHRGL